MHARAQVDKRLVGVGLSQSGPGGAGPPDVPGAAGATFASYGLPAANAAGHSAFASSLTVGTTGVIRQNAHGIFARLGASATYAPLARVTDPAGDTGGAFASFKDPVLASDDDLAFFATLSGVSGSKKATLWHRPPGGNLALLAQSGTSAAGTSGQWRSFDSLAIATGRGPLFAATLKTGQNGVNAANAHGVWAAEPGGKINLLFRARQTVGGQTLKSFTLLNATTGSLGATRSFNAAGQVVWRATFTDNTTAIVSTVPP